MMDRYGEEIEYDLQNIGVDVVDFFRVGHDGERGKRRLSLRKFRSLLGQLPGHGRYHAKMADDDEWVGQQLDAIEGNPELKKQIESQVKKKPTLDGYTVEAQKLDHVIASLNFVASLVDGAISQGKNRQGIPQVAPPETARDRWEQRKARTKAVALDAEILEAQQRWSQRQERLKRETTSVPSKNLPPRDALGRFVKRK